MPSIDKYQEPQKKDFKKKSYRPWLLEDSTVPTSDTEEEKGSQNLTAIESKPISSHLVSSSEPESIHLDGNKESTSNQKVINRSAVSHPLEGNKESEGNHVTHLFSLIIEDYDEAINAVLRLTGVQRKIIFCVVDHCTLNGKLSSGAISMETFMEATNASVDTIKSATQRLIKKRILAREEGKRGDGGFSIFRVTEAIRRVVIEEIKKESLSSQLVTKRGAIPFPSSSNNIYNLTTTTEPSVSENSELLPQEWQEIDIEPLEGINFSKHHLKQIYKQGKLKPDEVQDSILAFSFDIKENEKASKINGDPINFFMGILKKGFPFTPPKNYVSPREQALQEYLTRKRQEKERLRKLEEEAHDFAFQDWSLELSEENVCEIIPEKKYREDPFRDGMLKSHFKEKIWPTIKSKI